MRRMATVVVVMLGVVLVPSAAFGQQYPIDEEAEDQDFGKQPPEDPSNEDPSNEDPSNEDPSNEDPSNKDPSNKEPFNEEPFNEEPSNKEPFNEEPFNKRDCGFQPGATADIRLNDTAAGTKQVGSDGCVRLTVRIVDQDTVSIDGREYDARPCASNTIFVAGPVADGAEERQMRNHFTISCPATATGALPRTGNEIADLAALGGVLVVAGATGVTIVRRRRNAAVGYA